MEKQEKKQKKILTDNRLTTIGKREASYEGLAEGFQNGEDGVYNLINDNKHMIFRPKIEITEADVAEVPTLAELRQDIRNWEQSLKKASGRDAYLIKNALIEMRKDQYVLKQQWRQPITATKVCKTITPPLPLEDTSYYADGEIVIQGISLMSPVIVSTILQNYSRFAEDAWGRFDSDLYYLMQEFDAVASLALQEAPLLERLVELKVDGVQNAAIQEILKDEFDVEYTVEYLSSLWRKKIPKIIAEKAQELFLIDCDALPLKQCGRCKKSKPAHPLFFNRNKASYDGFYSICKACRNKRKGVEH